MGQDDQLPGAESVHTVAQAVDALRALLLAGDQLGRAVADHFDMSVTDILALSHLVVSGPLTARAVSEAVGLSPSSTTALLDRLANAGFAARNEHPTDRRQVVVTYTESGLQAMTWTRTLLLNSLGTVGLDRLPDTGAMQTLAEELRSQTRQLRQQNHASRTTSGTT
jgi:DNA-binding MarR family transcriptional regulator